MRAKRSEGEMKYYCAHNWDIDFVCDKGQTARCKRCGSCWAGPLDEFPGKMDNPTVIAFSEDEMASSLGEP